MKLSTISIIAVTFALSLACSPKITNLEDPVVETTDEGSAKDETKFKPTKNMVSIDPLVGNYTITVGQQVYYTANVHGSVGSTAQANSSEEAVLAFDSEVFEFNDKKAAEMPGGDAAQNTFIFKAIKPGIATVMIQHLFRGDLENEYEITINVIEK